MIGLPSLKVFHSKAMTVSSSEMQLVILGRLGTVQKLTFSFYYYTLDMQFTFRCDNFWNSACSHADLIKNKEFAIRCRVRTQAKQSIRRRKRIRILRHGSRTRTRICFNIINVLATAHHYSFDICVTVRTHRPIIAD